MVWEVMAGLEVKPWKKYRPRKYGECKASSHASSNKKSSGLRSRESFILVALCREAGKCREVRQSAEAMLTLHLRGGR